MMRTAQQEAPLRTEHTKRQQALLAKPAALYTGDSNARQEEARHATHAARAQKIPASIVGDPAGLARVAALRATEAQRATRNALLAAAHDTAAAAVADTVHDQCL